jgi:hypothetical protein
LPVKGDEWQGMTCATNSKAWTMHACLGRVPDEIRVEVERGLTLTAATVAELRSLSNLPPGLILVIHNDPDPRFDLVRLERR